MKYMNNQNSQTGNKKGTVDQAALLHFIDDLIKERKDANVTPKVLSSTRALLLRELNTDINTHMINLLNNNQKKELSALLDKNVTDDKLNDFFVRKIPNVDIEIAKVMLQFRAAYLGLVPASSADRSNASVTASKPELKEAVLPPAPIDTRN